MKTGSAAIVAVHILAPKRDASVPRGVMNRQAGDAGPLLRDPRCGYRDDGYMLAGRNIRRRNASDCVVGSNLDTGTNLIHAEPSSIFGRTFRDRRTVRIGVSGDGLAASPIILRRRLRLAQHSRAWG